jgi:hypothetical protein
MYDDATSVVVTHEIKACVYLSKTSFDSFCNSFVSEFKVVLENGGWAGEKN